MEADLLVNAMEGIEIDQDKALQVRPGRENAEIPSDALQPQPEFVAMTSEPAVNPAIEKPFPLLTLPSEVRNIVYRYPQIYEDKSTWMVFGALSNLHQPPITRANRQIRDETLPIFYTIFKFRIDLPGLPANDHQGTNNNRDTADYIRTRLWAFLPGPSDGPRASNLRFLTSISFTIQIGSTSLLSLNGVGVVMSGSSLDRPSDPCFEGVVDTTGLDWDNLLDIETACVEGIDSCLVFQDVMEFLGANPIRSSRVDKAASVMASLMYIISKQSPHLTRNIRVILDPTEELYEGGVDMVDVIEGLCEGGLDTDLDWMDEYE